MPPVEFTCPHCAQNLEVPGENAGGVATCPACGGEIRLPAPTPTTTSVPDPAAGSQKCAICLSAIAPDEASQACPACGALYHADCWQENGGCAIYGCSQVPAIEKRRAIDLPVSYWGQEHKQCPNCHQQILAAAVRCRHCGTTFESARPQDADEFQQRGELKQRLPAVRKTVLWLFIFSVVPCLAPVGAVWGLVWYPSHREEVRALPSIYDALCKIGLAVSIAQTMLVVFLLILYSVLRA